MEQCSQWIGGIDTPRKQACKPGTWLTLLTRRCCQPSIPFANGKSTLEEYLETLRRAKVMRVEGSWSCNLPIYFPSPTHSLAHIHVRRSQPASRGWVGGWVCRLTGITGSPLTHSFVSLELCYALSVRPSVAPIWPICSKSQSDWISPKSLPPTSLLAA